MTAERTHGRDVPFETATPELRQHLTRDGRPALFTVYPEADRILLPRTPDPRLSAPLEQTLYRRRTHRSFSAQPVSLYDLAVLLGTVFGPAEFIDGFEYGALIRRTSPSGGARQELDAYLATPNVTGVPAGLFHPRHASRHRRPERLPAHDPAPRTTGTV
ncbi:hypothetical protein [Streptomyces tubercidicus]|uniref:Nitroreductase domain-containing protein n=1 Tax=Streptomyces tubercidicus TaxID=47759 RepID=A0A640USS1_9ACTN|nr:hypothetical protein [Streptomyces tubercidicus]WAU13263.1 hypothetical protein STRTU_003727 [Streptomyces tubercidicus]GFE38839.1 hypothetical protein Stube_35120 [Streptomyces tubercidicus]